jgi:hypothetical protein
MTKEDIILMAREAGLWPVDDRITAIKEALAQPAQRPWVGLTDEELSELSASGLALWALWRAIEAKLKEKNT